MAIPSKVDVIVVGSGPGGATVARDMALNGKNVLLLERGIDHRPRSYYGTYLGALIYSDRSSLLFTEEGLNIVRPLMVGGATSMYCGCAAPATRLAKREIRRRHRPGSLRDHRRAGDRAVAGRATRPGLHAHRPGCAGPRL